MSERADGGPAFPGPIHPGHDGMTLRDWFAGQALVGIAPGIVEHRGSAQLGAGVAYELRRRHAGRAREGG